MFYSENPSTGRKIERAYPVSGWEDCDAALNAAVRATKELEHTPPNIVGSFLKHYASGIEASARQLADAAQEETGLDAASRFLNGEIPRSVNQLRQASRAAEEGSWRRGMVDNARNIRSCFAPIGPVLIFGPNNFPFAFHAVSGGDFAAAIAAGNPVVAKAHPLHPHVSQLLAEIACNSLGASGMPASSVQMLYHTDNETGLRLVADRRLGAISFTGSKAAGLKLKDAAEKAGNVIYLEMSSLNPVVFLPEGMKRNAAAWAATLADSCTTSGGQLCTRPNIVFLLEGSESRVFLREVAARFHERSPCILLSSHVVSQLHSSVSSLIAAGAERIAGAEAVPNERFCYPNTLLRITGQQFVTSPHAFQREAFGNEVLVVVAGTDREMFQALELMEGSLTASVYSAESGEDDAFYDAIAPILRRKSGRMLNDKMPTGVALSPAMNHGGPYPSTGHPGFTAVGIPTSIARFTVLHCYDNVRKHRLPGFLRDCG